MTGRPSPTRTTLFAAPFLALVAALTYVAVFTPVSVPASPAAAPATDSNAVTVPTTGPTAGPTAVKAPALDPLAAAPAAVEPVPAAVEPAVAEPSLFATLAAAAPTLDRQVLERALAAAACAVAEGEARRDEILTVIDYSLPSAKKRLWTFDLARGKLLFHERVAHGKNTGLTRAERFSNDEGSLQTSLGLFRTADTYIGGNGYSLRLHGLEPGVNDRALERLIVIHGAWYVSDEFATQHGRIGRSWGCPAVRAEVARPLIDRIKGGSLVFAYYPDDDWLGDSRFLTACTAPGGATPDTVLAAR